MFYDLITNTTSSSNELKSHMEDFILHQVHLNRILYKYPTYVVFSWNETLVTPSYWIMTFEIFTIWIRIPIQFIKHLEIGLNMENGMLSFSQFVDSRQGV